MIKQAFLIIIWELFAISLIAQKGQKTDSIYNLIKTAHKDSTKIGYLLELGSLYNNSLPDSAIYFYNLAFDLATKNSDKKNISLCLKRIGSLHINKGDYIQATEMFKKALTISEEIDDKTSISTCYNSLGNILFYQGDYPQAIINYLMSLKIDEEKGDSSGMADTYNNIGCVYFEQANYTKALEYYEKSLKIYEIIKDSDKDAISRCYNGFGNVYATQGDTTTDKTLKAVLFSKAINFYNKSFKIKEELGDKFGMSRSYNFIGYALSLQKSYDKAIVFFLKSLALKEEVGDKAGIAIVLGNISQLNTELKQYNKAVIFAKRSLGIAKEIGSLDDEKQAYYYLYTAYKGLGFLNNALENHELYAKLNDSIFNQQKNQQLTNIEAIYQSEKKQKEIELLEKTKVLQKTEIKRQTTQKYAFIIGFASMLLLVVITFYSYRKIESQNNLIKKKNEELNMQKEEILSQRDNLQLLNVELSQQKEEVITQRDEISHQNSIIEKHNKKITSSIYYAQRIQKAILPSEANIKTLFPQNFVIFKPKDIVSGDFYWFEKKEDKIYFAAADCTGHGVPGGFMSMLSYNLLNDAINEQHIAKPSEIINFIGKRINKILRQRADDSSVKDGLDLALCCYDSKSMLLEFAGVQSTMFLISNNNIKEYSSDWHPIGEPFHDNFFAYSNTEINVTKGDSIYLSTDGYTDQFGGELLKKYTKKQLKEYLLSIHQLSMTKQKEKLENAFETWKGSHEQIDDVLLLGIKL